MRDDFDRNVRQSTAARVGLRCSNPSCQRLTSGPAANPARAINIGVAAHITAASPGGPRYDPTKTQEQRSSIDNAIWLCAACAALVDRDTARFSETILREWRSRAETAAAQGIAAGTKYRPVAASEVLQELTVGEIVAVKALEEEFGCHVETELHVAAGDRWIRLDAAVVRGEDLIAIDIREHHGKGFPVFQIEYLLEICTTMKLQRFQNWVLYVVVVSDGSQEADVAVESQLRQLADASALEVHVRMYRLNELRAKYGV